MPGLSQLAHSIANSAHQKLLRRMLSIYEVEVNPRDVVDAIVPKDELELLQTARRLGMRPEVYHSNVAFEYRGNRIRVDCDTCSPLPKYAVTKAQTLLPEYPFADTLKSWADNIIEVQTRFALGEHVLNLLNDKCASPKQVRHFLPGIVTLLKLGDADELAAKLSGASVVRNPPTLPSGARQAVMDYNALIAQASLLPDRQVTSRMVSLEFNYVVPAPWHK